MSTNVKVDVMLRLGCMFLFYMFMIKPNHVKETSVPETTVIEGEGL